MVVSVADDVAFGEANELRNKGLLEKLVGCGLTKDPNRWASMDFYNENKTVLVELKSRRIRSDLYATAIISADKIHKIRDNGTTHYLAWAYEDGLFYVKYDKEKWDKYECKMYKRYNRSDRIEYPKLHYFVPRTDLIAVEWSRS